MHRDLRRLGRHVGLALEIGGYLFWLAIDFVTVGSAQGGLNLVIGGLVAGIVLMRRRRGANLARLAHVAIGLSIALSVAMAVLGLRMGPGYRPFDYEFGLSFTEELALAILVIAVLRSVPLRPALVITGLAAVAIVGSPVGRFPASNAVLTFATLCALGWGGSVAIGLTIREIETRRTTALVDARSAERLELARELHDVIAHQVTGIVVAAQAAAVVARKSPDEVDKALAAIEAAGGEALAAMRRMVGVLRGGENAEGARTPGAELGDLQRLVAGFDPDGRLVTLVMDPGLEHAVLPAGVAATGYRVVQEALTNVRRHAADASTVEIELRVREEALHVMVRNDGLGSRSRQPRGGVGGFGLAGMAERVGALDGELTAGPAGPDVWQVDARLPLRGSR